MRPPQQLLLPHFAHNEHVLTRGYARGKDVLYTHDQEPNGTRHRSRHGMVRISECNKGTHVATGYVHQAFAYVESKEPLNAYRLW